MTAVLGIDLDPFGLTALVADVETGRTLGSARVPLGVHAGPGGVREQDPVWWWEALVEAIRSFDGLLDVRAVAVSGPPHGLVCVDGGGEPIGPATLGTSTSARAWALALTDALGGPEAVRRLLGTDLRPGYSAPQLARLREIDRDRYDRASLFCLPHDHLTSRLLGAAVTDLGDASGTGYFDVRERRWSDDVLGAIDPSGRLADRLPAIAPPGVALGTVKPDVARRLSLRPDVAVVNGTGAPMATAVAMGLFAPGRLGISLDTSGAAFAYSPHPACDPLGQAAAFCDATGGWLAHASTVNCAQVLHAVAGMFGTDVAALERAAAAVPPGAGGLALLPHIEGEHTPDLPDGSGVLWGLGPGNLSAAHLGRAAFDGVTLALAAQLHGLQRAGADATSAVVAGPGADVPLWCQTVADVTGLAVRRVPVGETAAWGAAALAGWALTGDPVEVVVRRWWREAARGRGSITQPDPAAHELYLAELERRQHLMEQLYPETVVAPPPVSPPRIPEPTGEPPVPPPGQPGGPPLQAPKRPLPWTGTSPSPRDSYAAFRP